MDAKLKGGFFIKTLEYVSRKQGSDALKEFQKPIEFYQEEHWYPFDEFCQNLEKMERMFQDDRKDTLFLLGRATIKRDTRWSTMFKGKDPKDVFGVNTRQDDQVRVGDFNIEEVSENHIRIKMSLWSENLEHTRIWSRYYLGCSQAIMDLTGKKGFVSTRPDPENQTVIFFEFNWS